MLYLMYYAICNKKCFWPNWFLIIDIWTDINFSLQKVAMVTICSKVQTNTLSLIWKSFTFKFECTKQDNKINLWHSDCFTQNYRARQPRVSHSQNSNLNPLLWRNFFFFLRNYHIWVSFGLLDFLNCEMISVRLTGVWRPAAEPCKIRIFSNSLT